MSNLSCIKFSKYHGAGNDFILIDDRSLFFPCSDAKRIATLCHRHFGIGADGVIVVQPSTKADIRMRIFNADGSEAESCGNGLRCFLQFLLDLGEDPARSYEIEIADRKVIAAKVGEQIGVQMGIARALQLDQTIGGYAVHCIDTGVPHAVVFVDDVQQVDLPKEGSFLRHHPYFQPRGTNVDFAAPLADGSYAVRTFERGVERETLACGTGAVAVGVIAALMHQKKGPIRTHFPGGTIEIHFVDPSKELQMVGNAQKVFEGTFSFADS